MVVPSRRILDQTTASIHPPFHLVHSRAECCANTSHKLHVFRGTHDRRMCEDACIAQANCSFISHDAFKRRCELCRSCDVFPNYHFSSWSREYFEDAASVLTRVLDDSYSRRVYRQAALRDLGSLRLVWLHLLDAPALRAIARVRVCQWQAAAPWRPFFTALDLHANPASGMWISHEESSLGLPVLSHTLVEVTHCPHRRWHAGPLSPPSRGALGWQFGPMWLFASAGSGVSVSVGRTIAMSHEDAARLLRLLFPRRLECSACEAGCEWGRRPRARPRIAGGFATAATNASSPELVQSAIQSASLAQASPPTRPTSVSLATPSASKSSDGHPVECITELPLSSPPGGIYGSFHSYWHRATRANRTHRCWHAAALRASIDSIQVLDHFEPFSHEPRHEIVNAPGLAPHARTRKHLPWHTARIVVCSVRGGAPSHVWRACTVCVPQVMLRHGECASLANASALPPGFVCGRAPNVWACTGSEPAFAEEAKCVAAVGTPGGGLRGVVAKVLGEPSERCQRRWKSRIS